MMQLKRARRVMDSIKERHRAVTSMSTAIICNSSNKVNTTYTYNKSVLLAIVSRNSYIVTLVAVFY
jgi:hypothetical protein